MIKVEWFYWLCGFLFLVTAVVRLRDREDNKRFGSAAFWAILAFSFGYGSFVINKTAPALVEGIAVLLLVVLASCHFPGRGSTETTIDAEREKSAKKFGNKLFMLALIIPFVAAIFAVAGMRNVSFDGSPLLETLSLIHI